MAITQENLEQLVERSSDIITHRTLILHDASKDYLTYTRFPLDYEGEPSLVGVISYFDDSVTALKSNIAPVHTKKDLPILSYVYRYKVVLISKDHQGKITMSDGQDNPVDTYIGLER